MAVFADVIIDISYEKLDKTFQYKVPDELLADLQVGMQVEVPFGRYDSKRTAYVVGISDTPKFDVGKTKELLAIKKDSISLEQHMLGLAAWIRENYGGTMNQALKTVLPVKQKKKEKEKRVVSLKLDMFQALELLPELERKHQTARARLLGALIQQSPLPYEVVTGKLNITAAVIKAMVGKGFVEVISTREYRNPLSGLKKGATIARLNSEQQAIVDTIWSDYQAGDHTPCLIHGVTGSGKTEVYIELIARAVEEERQAIVLIPEIALTYQTVMRFYNRFGNRVAVLNSKMSAGERYDAYEQAKEGKLDVMIGPRSALFTPFQKLGLIIIDEEHEATYKSEGVPRYHARETAIQRAKMTGGRVILGSATPSLESYYRAKEGIYKLYKLTKRAKESTLPAVEIVDLRKELKNGNKSILSKRLKELIRDRLKKKQQIMLFLNRRGMAGFVSCRSCGHVIKCPHCDISLSIHRGNTMMCHYCGYQQAEVKVCPECGSNLIGAFRAGTQKVEDFIKKIFPEARVLRMDADTTKHKGDYEAVLSAFANKEADILIGTQMIVKGHDFPNVTLVGILAADLSLHVSDYRAAERTFQLLTQAAGRAGRGEHQGRVIIQTYQPEHYSVTYSAAQNYEDFFEEEMGFRGLMHYPPAWDMLVIHMHSTNQEKLDGLCQKLKEPLEKLCRQKAVSTESLQLFGPMEAGIAKVNDIYRRLFYIKGDDYKKLVEIKDYLEKEFEKDIYDDIHVQFDFNPMNF